ncbi:class I SAM-dependent methyltransferase [Xanthovirga aplysinae]|uniref:class I SAM-dependent methyltransferase n=1 Tax=Xanthovirga aplysinae TaxID=2529853 RepID=UPI0012BC7E6D|nr:class I SAM-dependent methyltransferase [Xanthovirga aplysinae]MTI31072.1 class I SAM-dependent methyltransferase [Xanthovirga aplysinae]
MEETVDYIEINKASWNNRTEVHFDSEFYDNEGFIKGKSSLNEIELKLLGEIKGKSVLHLQCHFGQDTISLSRLGAKATGVDLSDKAIQKAKELNSLTNSDCKFICCNVYDIPHFLEEEFDIVYTSYGVIGWLPDLNKWASLISQFLKPGGKLVFVEFHPVVWMFDDDFQKVHYNYLKSGPIRESESVTYADREAAINQEFVTWNHGIGEVVNNLIEQGLEIKGLDEFDYSPYNCFNHTTEFEPNKFRIKHMGNKIPMVYAIVAEKK